jgi:hypothetical protein
MKEYVAFPEQWRQGPDRMRKWIAQSLSWAETLPEKLPAKKQRKGKEG